MNIFKDQEGAVFIEAAVILPLLMVVMLLFLYLINIFVVQSLVQYGLNQTVNELGNYTYYLSYIGLVDWSNDQNGKLKVETQELRKDIDKVTDSYNKVVAAINSGKKTLDAGNEAVENIKNIQSGGLDMGFVNDFISGVNETKDNISTAKDSVTESWDMIKGYAENPSELLSLLKSQALLETKDFAQSILGALLGKIMLNKYIGTDILNGCGVVSTSYNGQMTGGEYLTGIDGMDFSASTFLGSDDSRVIDIIVVYRIKFPFNVSKWFSVESGPLYDNSLLIAQRAIGYGWINGDNEADGVYNDVDKKGLSDVWS